MRTMANYLIIMLTVMLFIFRLVVVFTTTMGMEFMVQSINVNFEINILSILNNLLFVPLISFIIYPLCILSLIIPYLEFPLGILINLTEQVSE